MPHATAAHEFGDKRRSYAELNGSAVDEFPADALADEEARGAVGRLADRAHKEAAVLTKFDLHPVPRLAGPIRTLAILSDEAFVAMFPHELPGVEAVRREASDREDQLGTIDDVLESAPPLV